MAFRAPLEHIRVPHEPFRTRIRVEGGVPEVTVAGDIDQISIPDLLEEIRHAASLMDVLDRDRDRPEPPQRLNVDLSGTRRLEAPAVEELMALVFELEAEAGMTIDIVHRRSGDRSRSIL
jgi:hypothetical protein